MIISEGYVLGRLWGGGYGIYAARKLDHRNFEELQEELRDAEDLGGYDDGMGFEEVIGAVYYPKETVSEGDWVKTRYLPMQVVDHGMTEEQRVWLVEVDR